MGVVGAGVDAIRIKNNQGTVHGRLRSLVSEAALKYGLEADQLPKRSIVDAVKEQIRKAGEYDAFCLTELRLDIKRLTRLVHV